MVADVARFVRFVGKERFDLAALPRQADVLRASATELIRKDATKQTVALIRRPRLVTLSGVGRLQWPSNKDIVARRMGRMVTAVGLGGPSDRIPPTGTCVSAAPGLPGPARPECQQPHARPAAPPLGSLCFGRGPCARRGGPEPCATHIAAATTTDVPLERVGKKSLENSSLRKLLSFVACVGSQAAWRGRSTGPISALAQQQQAPAARCSVVLRHPRPGARGGRSRAALNGGRNVASSSPATKGTECLQLRRQPLAGDGHGARQLAGPRGRRPRHRDRVVPWREERLRKERQLDAADGCRGGGIRGAQADPQPVSNNAKR